MQRARRRFSIQCVCFAAALLPLAVVHAMTTTVVDVPSRGGTQRFLYTAPAAPVANIVSAPGGSGIVNIADDGTFGTTVGLCDPVGRNRQALAERGYAVAMVDRHSSGTVRNPDDYLEVIRYMQARANVPTWVRGGSASTSSVHAIAATQPADAPVGLIYVSPGTLPVAVGASIRRPTLVLYHSGDRSQEAEELFGRLTAAPIKELVAMTGGNPTVCLGAHGLGGLDNEIVTALTSFIDRVNATFPAPSAAVATAVEYFHAGFGHYYTTAFPHEIAALDGGAFGGVWKRTGQSFPVWTAPGPGTTPVCRFFSTAFAPKSSHFYTPFDDECTSLKAGANWSYEAVAFHLVPPDATGACPAGRQPLYRLYNDGRSGAPNHRYTTSAEVVQQTRSAGWISEGMGALGVIACAPSP
jgi:hypothetical protein